MLIGQDICILGAGIGGLASAVALAMRGAAVTVLEQADAVREVGAGIQVSPNGLAVLDALGVGDELRARCLRSQAVHLLDGLSGESVLRMDLAGLRPQQEFFLVHRADLVSILLDRATELGVRVETGCRVSDVDLRDDSATLTIEGQAPREVGFLIGADGLHSVLRHLLNGKRQPFFTGQVAWRAIIPATGDEPQEARVFMGPGRHFVTYPLRDGSQINIVAVEERKDWAEEGWNHRDDPANLKNAFASFAPVPRALIDRVEEVHIWGLFRHAVADQWHKGPAVILGDAAHPTLPFMAQGAVMALEDAWVLSDSLSVAGLDEGPALYQARRRHRAERVIEAANANARNYHYANPLLRFVGHNALRVAGKLAPNSVLSRYDWIYDYDVTSA
ncbi:FAD-dependent monooxygenase [Maritimibacter sp. UBA3975]|uniref:FAD-dependent monooxygenase n=1 Tax=Maritimibacter sp. UBA3975 TaxID=1946833 RepID=UPI000C0A3C99|nr:FAD-dependent monooxygenase [Maritimibacter sp. UBA3975]MAM60103.1 monooxygenase [Maritimibacter sp.]|tara:strand:+ start:15670 stop:16839 length:1170 start_codon:yes stop_codon:yes gene_type:complete